MATEKKLHSDLPIPPGNYLAEVLAIKKMSQAELARRIGRPVQAVNEIIKGNKAITPATAIELERALEVPAHIWTGLEAEYQLIKARLEKKGKLQEESSYLDRIPYKELAELNCVQKTRDKELKVEELQRFYRVASLANLPEVRAYGASFRCAATKEASSYALAAWIRCAEIRTAGASTATYDAKKLRAGIPKIRALSLKDPEDFIPEIKRILEDCGIAFILQPHFPKSYAHGAVFWPSADKAVLVLSIRGKWADIFWVSLFHEIGHLLHDPGKTFVDDGNPAPGEADKEEEADRFAEGSLISKEIFDEFLAAGDFSRAAIITFAERTGIHPGFVVGRLQHQGRLKPNSVLNRLRVRYAWKE